jgi:2,4-dienoyl-CoA reductase (NADPH2)
MTESPLFQPLKIAGLDLKNRIVLPPMSCGLADEQGFVTDRLIDYYERRAKGGVGTICIEATIITPDTAGVGPETRIHGPEYVAGLRRLVEALKVHDVTVGLQLWHPGRQTKLGKAVAPSPISIAKRGETPHALTLDDIEELYVRYAEAAAYTKEAGFDFVEVHGAHCYLPCEFMSPLSNERDDEYGGSLENRAKFAVRVVEAIRREVGPDYPLFYRISGAEVAEGGFGIEDSVQVSQWLVAAGVDCMSVSAGNWHALHYTIPPMFMERGCLVPYAEAIKAAVPVPVIAVGRLDAAPLAESVIAEGRADLVAIGRGLIADPDWPDKVRTGRTDEIRPCISCNACVELVSNAQEARCAVNPEVAREGTWQIAPAATPRRVMVVGSGPAGLEAARIARLRGHDVSIWERDNELGGKFEAAASAPSKTEVLAFRDYQCRVIADLGVEIHTGVEVTKAVVDDAAPDAVIVATGASPLVPPIPGIDRPTVFDAQEVLLGRVRVSPGERVAIIGASATGSETAEYLVDIAGVITLIDMLPFIGRGVEMITRKKMYRDLLDNGVHVLTNSRVVEIGEHDVLVDPQNAPQQRIEVDRVILALGWVATGATFADDLDGAYEVLVVGDADEPRDFVAGINSGADAALAV